MAEPPFDLLIRNGICLLPWGADNVDVGVRDGRIAALGVPRSAKGAVFDAAGLHVLPGLIDPHVHLRDPGDGSVETLTSGTLGAVLGGVTCVFDMPNTQPSITTLEMLHLKRASVPGRAWCDVGIYVGATRENTKALAEYEVQAGVCAIKVFAGSSTGDLLIEDDAGIEAVMRSGHRRIAFHSEDEYRLQARRGLFAVGEPHARHMEWRDPECAALGTRRLIALAHKTGRPIHILHVSTAEELSCVAAHRGEASVEVLVNHLTQIAPECYERLGGYAVMNPPIRDARHFEAAWAAVRDGRVDTIGSDHAPHTREAKERPWPQTAAGLTGVQTSVPIMLDHVHAGRLSLARMVDLMAAGPARVYGLRSKGRLAVGYDADLTVVDLKARRHISNGAMASPCGWTPFDGMAVTGWPVATILRGKMVMRDDEVCGKPEGQLAGFG